MCLRNQFIVCVLSEMWLSVIGLGEMGKNLYLCIFWPICDIRYISWYFSFCIGLKKNLYLIYIFHIPSNVVQ